MDYIKILFLVTAIGGFIYGFYCQMQARKYISKEKIMHLKDTSKIATGPMPPKEILSDEGLIYYKGFKIGVGVFMSSLVILLAIAKYMEK